VTASSALVIFGATGDLAQRMLFPSLYFLDEDGLLPEDVAIVGSARTKMTPEAFAAFVEKAVRERAEHGLNEKAWKKFRARLSYASVDASDSTSFAALGRALEGVRETVFYLSTSPAHYGSICENLKAAGLVHDNSRVVVEKPIGHDLASNRQINEALSRAFSEDRIFRIDHYLGKEAVQNLLALRFANTLFEPLWNKVAVDHVQITVAETIGVEDRWSYYDEYGAIRDMVQNHLLQLLALVAMEPPADLNFVRDEKVKVLRSLRPITDRDVERNTVRGQYRAGVSGREAVPGYIEETGGRESNTETFVALCAHIDNWRWAGVPFFLRTGKRLPARKSEIIMQFRNVPHSIFPGNRLLANRLIIKLQPDEEIALTLMNKTPSLERNGMELKPLALNLSLSDAFKRPRRRIAYERLLLEALSNKSTLFVRRDEGEAAWTWIDEIVSSWERQALPLEPYASGTWGPSGAFALTERYGHRWYE
jgi:glucose-6-phosphate 1-dehydrogenase